MKVIKSKKGIAIVATLVVLAASAVGAYAYFTAGGTGIGNVTVASSATPFKISTSNLNGGPLTPTTGGLGSSETLKWKVKNQGSGNQQLTQLLVTIANNNGTAWSVAPDAGNLPCTAADFTINGSSALTGATISGAALAPQPMVPDATITGTLLIGMVDTSHNQDNCINASPPILITAS